MCNEGANGNNIFGIIALSIADDELETPTMMAKKELFMVSHRVDVYSQGFVPKKALVQLLSE